MSIIETQDAFAKGAVVDKDIILAKIRKDLFESLEKYRKTMLFMLGDAPLSVLCLDKATENCLYNHGASRLYDIFNMDFTKVKGLGKTRIRNLTACLDQFFSML